MDTKSLMNKLHTMAGVDKDGNSNADAAVAGIAKRLYGALAAAENPDLKEASYQVKLNQARESLRVKRATRDERMADRKDEMRILAEVREELKSKSESKSRAAESSAESTVM